MLKGFKALIMKIADKKMMEMAGIDDEAIKQHKKTYTNLEINVPVAYQNIFLPHVITMTQGLCSETYICKHVGLSGIKSIYDSLLENYEREICDVIRENDDITVYLFVTRLLSPGFKRSEKFRYIGFITVSNGNICLVWLHPFLRNMGVMKNFLLWYSTNEDCLSVSPPVHKSFLRVMASVQKTIREDKDLFSKAMVLCRKALKKISPNSDIDSLDDEAVLRVRHSLGLSHAMHARKELDGKVDDANFIEISSKVAQFLQGNPQVVEEMKDYYEKHPDFFAEADSSMEDFCKYGTFKKPILGRG